MKVIEQKKSKSQKIKFLGKGKQLSNNNYISQKVQNLSLNHKNC